MSDSVRAARTARLEGLRSGAFDVLVIGGGITGAGIARDAALRGLKVALVEKEDFAAGTSSRSSKLVHGGLRYLEHFEFGLVFEGTNERAVLLRLAPHLVEPLPFLLPSYRGDWPTLFFLDCGLWTYDALSRFSSPRLHRTYRARGTLALQPGLREARLRGGVVYYDCLTDDARLTIENMLDAEAAGAIPVNHLRARSLLVEEGRIVGVKVVDELEPDAESFDVRARVVVNATGPWCDEIRAMAGQPPLLGVSKGIHVVVDAERLPLAQAIVMKKGHRIVFGIPWGNRTVIGTTDTFYEGRPEDVCADAADVDYLFELVRHYFPGIELSHADVIATWAGLRPLLRPDSEVTSASDVSRGHTVKSSPGLVTVAGGKLTTFRRMACEVVERVGEQLGGVPPCPTDDRPIGGALGLPGAGLAGVHALRRELAARLGLSADSERIVHLVHDYGVRARAIVDAEVEDPALGAPLVPDLPYALGEVDFVVAREHAATVCDVMVRRMAILYRARDQGLAAVEQVATRMARLWGWSPERTAAEIAAYRDEVARSRRFALKGREVDEAGARAEAG